MRGTICLLKSIKTTVQQLLAQRKQVILLESDIQEMHMKGTGPGGQAVNKTSNAVCLVHTPTGIQVKSHKTRYMEINRRDAKKKLQEALDLYLNGPASLSAIAEMRERERKRVKTKKSQRKHNKIENPIDK